MQNIVYSYKFGRRTSLYLSGQRCEQNTFIINMCNIHLGDMKEIEIFIGVFKITDTWSHPSAQFSTTTKDSKT